MILALDISLKTGFAYGAGADSIRFGTRDFTGVSPDNAVRGRRFNRWLCELMTEIQPHDVYIEKGFYKNGLPTTALLWGLNWEANRVAEIRNIPRAEIIPASIKKFITGNGRATKEQVMEAVRARGYGIGNDHEGDAVALLLYAMEGR